MIPDPEVLSGAWTRLAPTFGLEPKSSAAAIRIALREADHLSDDIYDVPGALLFALGRHPRCFSGFRVMSVLVIEQHVKTLGFKLEAGRFELAEMLGKIALRELDYDEVRAWAATRLLPFGG